MIKKHFSVRVHVISMYAKNLPSDGFGRTFNDADDVVTVCEAADGKTLGIKIHSGGYSVLPSIG